MAAGKRIGQLTYLELVSHMNALFIGPSAMKIMKHAKMAMATHSDVEKKQELLHQRLGHPGRKRFNQCMQELDMDELRIGKRDLLLDDKCEVCIQSKQVKRQSHKPVPRARRPLQRVYMDFWGPNREGTRDERYYLSLVDDHTRYSWLFITTDRRYELVIGILEEWRRHVECQTGAALRAICMDNAKEFIALVPWAKS